MSKLIILIGLPGSGKTTWSTEFIRNNKQYIVASSDDIIEARCKEAGITYNEGFSKFVPAANKEFKALVRKAIKENQDLIIDRTNLTIKSRKEYLKLAVNYYKIAKVFETEYSNDRPGKIIPFYVIHKMKNSFEFPDKREGFDSIER